ncbi:MAG: DNA polymerase III subunit gamma/tau [Bacilli bacterium]|nr:DNA polymerase III subunit gamma/tau [Bacilli bacterium]
MAYKALYRTYRPQTFDEVAGQEHIVKTLKNALATGKIAHAYLFAGPRGTGKTTMAKLFAKALNCEEGIGHQCNECKNCVSIIEGNHPDVLELDAASNNGVDEIRELIDKVKYGTILGRYKVYIIDEVHMLSAGAFNALLKTLEEPPEHVIFILATTEPHKILPTILSRCQRYDFTKVSEVDIKERLKAILLNENVEYVEDAVELIVSLADGGMRDALSILEKVLAYSNNRLIVEDVLNIFALESKEEKIKLLKSIVSHDMSDVLSRLNNYVTKGTDIKRLTEDLLSILKDIVIYNSSNIGNYLESLKEEEASDLAKYISNEQALKMIDILLGAIKDYKNVTSINPLFEITLIKLTSLDDSAPKKVVVETPKPVEKVVVKEEPKPVIEKPVEVKVEEPKIEEKVIEEIIENPTAARVFSDNITPVDSVIYLKDAEQEDNFAISDELMVQVMAISKKEIKSELVDGWKNIKRISTHEIYGKAATLLIDGRPLVASPKVLILEYPLAELAEKVNAKDIQSELQTVINHIFGKHMFIYAVSRNQSIDLQALYMNLLQIGKLPKAKDVNLEFIGE